jgi:hypothetical protein
MYNLYKIIFLRNIIKMNNPNNFDNTNNPSITPVAPVAPVAPVTPVAPVAPVTPVTPVAPKDEKECEPEPCVPTEVPITLEIAPIIKLCVDKPTVFLKNNAECICTPCKEKE